VPPITGSLSCCSSLSTDSLCGTEFAKPELLYKNAARLWCVLQCVFFLLRSVGSGPQAELHREWRRGHWQASQGPSGAPVVGGRQGARGRATGASRPGDRAIGDLSRRRNPEPRSVLRPAAHCRGDCSVLTSSAFPPSRSDRRAPSWPVRLGEPACVALVYFRRLCVCAGHSCTGRQETSRQGLRWQGRQTGYRFDRPLGGCRWYVPMCQIPELAGCCRR